MRMVRIGGLYMPDEMIETMHREIDKMRDPIYIVIKEELERTERERNETLNKEHEALKKECEKLQNEVKYLRERNEELLKEIEREKQWNTFLERECHSLW